MIFKSLLKILLIILLFLYGCSSQPQERIDIEPQKSMLQGEILEWVEIPLGLTKEQSAQFQRIVTDSVQDFMKLNPRVKIVIEFVPSDETLFKLNQQISRGAGPNLFAISLLRKQLPLLIRSGYLKRLDQDNLDLSQFRPETLKQVSYQSYLYALPVNLATQVLCYNKSKIQETPKTLDDLISQARRGYSVGLHSSFREAFWGTGAFGGKLFDESGNIALAKNEGWVQWIQWLRNAGNEPNFFLIEDAETLQKSFVEEKLSYITCLSDWLPSLTEALGNNKLGVTLLPGRENQAATPPLWTVGFIFNRASSANQHQLSLKLAQFLSNAQSQQKVQVEVPFLIPVNKNVTVDFRLFPMQAVLVEQSQTGVIVSLDQIDKNQAFLEYGDIIYHKVLGGEITAEEAALQITQVINNQFN
ncbi:ABC transporter substrate-binding protein [Crocosphaera sp. UHCC 0190]|uniref:sugar ABC transporter substrate-binding protein n=1 Tax=Crocosphaera sp. UHCC 0190 TaxID=3110246 RepID=UPI002B20C732|nr:ABC transporter substrate-binding protein [Crocosphaera sp. UHCC 0190]MEA5512144.1 ABC transporter substrate-binding protein [Crocosphaera sp. UHCC 0190]